MADKTHLVYSTDAGRINPEKTGPTPPTSDGIVRIRRESAGRGGKAVSVITGLGLEKAALKQLAKELKRLCGVGGAVKQWNIELQGDQREKLKAELEARGFTVRLTGG